MDARPSLANDAMPTTRGLDFYAADPNLEFVCSTVMDPGDLERARPELRALGVIAGAELDELAAEADRNPPVLRAWDAQGRRVDEIVRHPAYRRMEELAFSRFGLAAMSHRGGVLGWPGPVPHVVKYALSYLFAQSEFGLLCPVSVTDSTSRMLRRFGDEALRRAYLPRLTTTDFASLWQGTQWMTERSGGSDVGASTTAARREADGTWRLWGEKWFCSNANADVAITLARPDGAGPGTAGLAMFLVPKVRPDGTKNAWNINRLKDKFGSRSMATGEVTYAGATAYVVGALDRGFKQMMEMVNVSRLSNAMRAAGIMRRGLLESVVHARARTAFGKPLIELPLLRANLLDMLLDTEAALSVVLNAGALLDRWDGGDADAAPLVRIVTPIAKCWITARARAVAGEAMNVRGGNGYIEEWPNPRLVRDAHLGAIWEGSTNVVALDVQRAILRDGCHEPLAAFIRARLDGATDPAAARTVAIVREALDRILEAIAAWPRLETVDRELAAMAATQALYHVLAAALLLAEGGVLRAREGSGRKLWVAGCYARRWLEEARPAFTARDLRLLDDAIDWRPIEGA
jgi:alkylation response protein AidB-like acyl-CoA dehydrogenase